MEKKHYLLGKRQCFFFCQQDFWVDNYYQIYKTKYGGVRMQLKDQEKPYSLSIMEKYCKDNIDIYYVEPIIREAFYEGLISPS